MAAVPLLKEEAMGSDDGYDRRSDISIEQRERRLFQTANIKWAFLCAGLLGLTVGISAGVAFLVVQQWSPQAETCISRTAGPSPVTRDVEITYHTELFNGSFMNENIYRQPGSPEVDAAWEALGVNCESLRATLRTKRTSADNRIPDRPLSIPYDVGLEVGLRPDQVKLDKKYGGGFPVNVEGLHHLHCAVSQPCPDLLSPLTNTSIQNLVRKALYYNIDYYRNLGTGAFVNDEPIVQKHVCK
jgi:hypothetical protein